MQWVVMFFGAVLWSSMMIAIGYYFGNKDGKVEEREKWKSEGEWVKKEGVKFE